MSTIDELLREAKSRMPSQRKEFYAKVAREHGKAVADGLKAKVESERKRDRVRWPN